MGNYLNDFIGARNSLMDQQRSLYVSTAANMNMRYRELLTNDFGTTLVKNCAWDVADRVSSSYFNTSDFYLSPQLLYGRIVNFSYENDLDLFTDSATIRKMLYETDAGKEALNEIVSKCDEAQKKLFLKEKKENGNNGKYIDEKLMKDGKSAYREQQNNLHDEVTGKMQDDLDHTLEVDHVQAAANACFNSLYIISPEAIAKLKGFYNSDENFQMLNKIANESKGDVKVFSDGKTSISGTKLVQEKKELQKKLKAENMAAGMNAKDAERSAKKRADSLIKEKWKDITYRATAKQQADAACDRWENVGKEKTREALKAAGILDENGKVKESVRDKLEENITKSMNAESKCILQNADMSEVAKSASEKTKESVKKIIVGQVIYYVLPPLVFETKHLTKKKGITLDRFFSEIKKAEKRIIRYVKSKLGEILKNTAHNIIHNFLRNFLDIVLSLVKEMVKKALRAIKQVVTSLVSCVRIIASKDSTPAEKADAVTKTLSVTITAVYLEILFEWLEDSFPISDILLEPLQIIVTVLVTNLIMLILEKADLFDVRYGLLVANIDRIFEEEYNSYKESSQLLLQNLGHEHMEKDVKMLGEQINEITNELLQLDMYQDSAFESLNKINDTFDMQIDFDAEWAYFLGKEILV